MIPPGGFPMSQDADACFSPRSGLSKIGEQHRKIAGIIERLKELADRWAMRNADSLSAWKAFEYSLRDLFVCYVEHFQFEEDLLQSCLYPKLTDHRHEHTRVLSYVAQCSHAMTVDMEVDLKVTVQFLATTFDQHELDEDLSNPGILIQKVTS
jgi:hemerythrin-like metal-binding protein